MPERSMNRSLRNIGLPNTKSSAWSWYCELRNLAEPLAHVGVERKDAVGGVDVDPRLFVHGGQEEGDPVAPAVIGRNLAHVLDIGILIALEIARNEEIRLAERAQSPEHQRDQHPPEPAIAVLERVQCLELDMGHGGAQERPQGQVADEGHQLRHCRPQMLGCDGDIAHDAGAFVADIILLVLVGAGRLVRAAAERQKLLMHGADQVLGQRLSVLQRLLGHAQGARIEIGLDVIVAHFAERVGRPGLFLGFEAIDLVDGRDRVFHPRRGNGILPAQRGKQEAAVHEVRHLGIIAGKRGGGLIQCRQDALVIQLRRREMPGVIGDGLRQIEAVGSHFLDNPVANGRCRQSSVENLC